MGFACCYSMHRHRGSSLQTAIDYEAHYLTVDGACIRSMCCRRLDGYTLAG